MLCNEEGGPSLELGGLLACRRYPQALLDLVTQRSSSIHPPLAKLTADLFKTAVAAMPGL